MTTTRPRDTDVVERMNAALDQLARLVDAERTSWPDHEVVPVEPAGRHVGERSRRRSVAAMAAAVLVLVVGAVALLGTGRSTELRSQVGPNAPGDVETYDLDLPDVNMTEDEILMSTTTDVVLWQLDDGSWLELSRREGAASALRADRGNQPVAASLPGEVFLPVQPGEVPSTLEVRWAREDGDAWFLRQFLAPDDDIDRLIGWLAEIEPTIDGGPTATIAGWIDGAGRVESRTRTWSVSPEAAGPGDEVTLEVIDAGASRRSNLLAIATDPPTPIDVAGTVGVRLESFADDAAMPGGSQPVVVQWAVREARTATLWIPARLADREEEILGALRPVGAMVPDDDSAYRVVDAEMTIDAGEDGNAIISAGAEDGIKPGHGVYDGGLVGVVVWVRMGESEVRLLDDPESVVAAWIPPDEDGSGITLDGTVRSARGEVVFTSDVPVPDGVDLTGRAVVIGGDPHSRLQFKVPIGTITTEADGLTPAWSVALAGSLDDGPVTIIVPNER